MFRKILIGYDGSDQAKDALVLGRVIAGAAGAELTVAGILPQDPLTGGREVLFKESDAELQRKVEQAAKPSGARPLTMPSSSPAHGLQRLAEEIEADLIVVGSSHRGRLGRAVAGTAAERLLHGAPCAVAIAPTGYRDDEHDLRVIGIGYDGLPESKEAVKAAIALAEQAEGTLRVFVAVYPPAMGELTPAGYPTRDYLAALGEHFRIVLEEALESIPPELRPSGQLLKREDGPAEVALALLEEAEKGVDLLCVGSRCYGPLRRVLLGSVSSELVKSTPCPLLIVPRGVHEELEGESNVVLHAQES